MATLHSNMPQPPVAHAYAHAISISATFRFVISSSLTINQRQKQTPTHQPTRYIADYVTHTPVYAICHLLIIQVNPLYRYLMLRLRLNPTRRPNNKTNDNNKLYIFLACRHKKTRLTMKLSGFLLEESFGYLFNSSK